MRIIDARAALLALAVAIPTLALAQQPTGGQRYKWHDAEGNLHYSDTLPPEAAKAGYDVVNASGIVVKHVDRAKTADELAAAKAEQAKAAADKQVADSQARSDQQMLAAYPTEDDLKRAQHQQLDMLDQTVTAAKMSMQSQEKSLAELLNHAAELDRSGKPVPATLAKQIADLRTRIDEQRGYSKRKDDERKAAAMRFDNDLSHYRVLKAKVDDHASH